MTIVALDIGDKRVGIAYENQKIIFPYKVVARVHLVKELKKLIQEKNVTSIVVGMPYGDFVENTQLEKTKKTLSMLKANFPKIPFFTEDERYTTNISSSFLYENGQDIHQKKDDIAASFILESYLNKL